MMSFCFFSAAITTNSFFLSFIYSKTINCGREKFLYGHLSVKHGSSFIYIKLNITTGTQRLNEWVD